MSLILPSNKDAFYQGMGTVRIFGQTPQLTQRVRHSVISKDVVRTAAQMHATPVIQKRKNREMQIDNDAQRTIGSNDAKSKKRETLPVTDETTYGQWAQRYNFNKPLKDMVLSSGAMKAIVDRYIDKEVKIVDNSSSNMMEAYLTLNNLKSRFDDGKELLFTDNFNNFPAVGEDMVLVSSDPLGREAFGNRVKPDFSKLASNYPAFDLLTYNPPPFKETGPGPLPEAPYPMPTYPPPIDTGPAPLEPLPVLPQTYQEALDALLATSSEKDTYFNYTKKGATEKVKGPFIFLKQKRGVWVFSKKAASRGVTCFYGTFGARTGTLTAEAIVMGDKTLMTDVDDPNTFVANLGNNGSINVGYDATVHADPNAFTGAGFRFKRYYKQGAGFHERKGGRFGGIVLIIKDPVTQKYVYEVKNV